jgi:hypothetical protein
VRKKQSRDQEPEQQPRRHLAGHDPKFITKFQYEIQHSRPIHLSLLITILQITL